MVVLWDTEPDIQLLMPLLAQAREPALYGLIGIVGTAIHGAAVVMLVEGSLAAPVPANIAGFICANVFSYLANSRVNFRRTPSLRHYLGFLGISLVGFQLTIFFAALAEHLRWHYLAGLALVVGITPMVTFWLLRKTVFRQGAADRTG